jgi:hypothetical protein
METSAKSGFKSEPTKLDARDEFAMSAMSAIIRSTSGKLVPSDLARTSYEIANAMIGEREKPIPTGPSVNEPPSEPKS